MFQVFARSWKGLNLSPGERAYVKLVEGWLVTAIVAGATIAYQQLMSGHTDYTSILKLAGGAAFMTLYFSVKKFLAGQTDLPLPIASLAGQVADVAALEVQKVVPSSPVAPPVVPAMQFAAPQQPFPQAQPPSFTYDPTVSYPQLPTVQPH